ncbi:TMEM143 family protein [Candidatus Poseidoniales archaeon]|jgi:hypothetical protein|nr:TMEM143 family protein [Candidatus Poseidoniales archaeon]
MDKSEEYYVSLLNAGYSQEQSKQQTQQYYPDFQSPLADVQDETKNNPAELFSNSGHFIPVNSRKLFSSLLSIQGIDGGVRQDYSNIITMLEAIWHHSGHDQLRLLKAKYELLDPDEPLAAYTDTDVAEFTEVLGQVLEDGNWELITQEEIDEALDGEDVLPISLDVRFDEFRTMRLYRLGQRVEEITIKKLFGLKTELRKVVIFENVISMLEFQNEAWFAEDRKRLKNKIDADLSGLHLRLFKDVPHLDLEIIFPNTSPAMRTFDKIKIAAPLVGGVVSLAMKYIPLLFGGGTGDTSLSVLGGVLAGIGTYVLKTYTSYQKTRENFRKIVARDMYFKGLANDSPVLAYVVDLGEEQEVKEAVLAYIFLSLNMTGLTEPQLDELVENWLNDTFNVDVDFEVDDAVAKLKTMNLLHENEDKYTVVNPQNALQILDEYWDGLYDY